jgi:hypothetical protein
MGADPIAAKVSLDARQEAMRRLIERGLNAAK